MVASDSFIEVRRYRWSDGSTTSERKDGCANLIWIISFASFLAGCGCFIGGCGCFVIAVLFWFLSFIWLFKTDLEFEIHYASMIGDLNTKLNNIQSQQPKFPHDEAKMAQFKADQEKKITEIRLDIAKLEQELETERVKRGCGRIIPNLGKSIGDEEAPPVPQEDPIFEKVLATEAELQRGIEKFINEIEGIKMETTLEEYFTNEINKDPTQIPELMKAHDITAEEASAEIRRTLFQNYSNELGEARTRIREEARLQVRMAIMNKLNGTVTTEESALLDKVRALL
jgi:hypothetical protein